jgi:hypothetical protein
MKALPLEEGQAVDARPRETALNASPFEGNQAHAEVMLLLPLEKASPFEEGRAHADAEMAPLQLEKLEKERQTRAASSHLHHSIGHLPYSYPKAHAEAHPPPPCVT